MQRTLKTEIPRSLRRKGCPRSKPASWHRQTSTGYSAWRGKRAGKRSSPGSASPRQGAAQPREEKKGRSTPLAANASRPLASPALSSGPVEGPPPRDPQFGAQTYPLQPSPFALLKPANPPGPVPAAKAPSQETAHETETRARASPRTSVPRLASLGKQVQNQVKEARRRSSEARRRRRASGPWVLRPDAGSRAGEVGCGQTKKKRSGFRPRSSGRGLALHLHFTLDQTPAEGREEAQNRRREERRARVAMLGWAQAGPQRACECVH